MKRPHASVARHLVTLILAAGCFATRPDLGPAVTLDRAAVESVVASYNHWSDLGLELFDASGELVPGAIDQVRQLDVLFSPGARVITICQQATKSESPIEFARRLGRARFSWRLEESILSGPRIELGDASATVSMTKRQAGANESSTFDETLRIVGGVAGPKIQRAERRYGGCAPD